MVSSCYVACCALGIIVTMVLAVGSAQYDYVAASDSLVYHSRPRSMVWVDDAPVRPLAAPAILLPARGFVELSLAGLTLVQFATVN